MELIAYVDSIACASAAEDGDGRDAGCGNAAGWSKLDTLARFGRADVPLVGPLRGPVRPTGPGAAHHRSLAGKNSAISSS